MNGMGVIQCVAGTHSAEEIKKASWLTSPDSSTLTAPVQSSRGGVVLTFVPKSSCDTTPVPVGSPLVLDLDGNGVRLTDERVRFDLAATGEMARIPALQGQDAFLALDLDGNGRIDSGVELFGNATSCGARRCSDGIEALEQHDANHDGAINAADAVYSELRIWRDDNRNGSCEAGELTSLAEAGIRSISLAARLDLSFVDARGNAATRSLVFERSTGARGLMPDVWFSLEFDRLPSDPRSSGIVTTAAAR